MSFPLTQIPLTANGNIRPGRFLTLVNGAGNFLLAVEATASTQILVGISERYPQGPTYGFATGGDNELYVAVAGRPLAYRGPLQIAEVLLGDTVSDARVLLTSDSQGRAIPLAPSNGTTTYYGAVALQGGAVNEFVPVYVLPPTPSV